MFYPQWTGLSDQPSVCVGLLQLDPGSQLLLQQLGDWVIPRTEYLRAPQLLLLDSKEQSLMRCLLHCPPDSEASPLPLEPWLVPQPLSAERP